jgi:hypothetical protein
MASVIFAGVQWMGIRLEVIVCPKRRQYQGREGGSTFLRVFHGVLPVSASEITHIQGLTIFFTTDGRLPVALLWESAPIWDGAGTVLLSLFSRIYSFFAGGYPATLERHHEGAGKGG